MAHIHSVQLWLWALPGGIDCYLLGELGEREVMLEALWVAGQRSLCEPGERP